MLTPTPLRSQIVHILLGVLLLGTLLSACGRTAQSATQDDIAASVTTTALPAATTVQLATVTLDGVIEQMAQERWLVGGTSILLDSQTTINGTPSLGGSARIRGVMTGDGGVRAQTIIVDAIIQPLPAQASPTILPTTIPTSTPLPQGTIVNINGVIEQVNITNNVTTIVVNSITYVVPHNFVVILGKQLRIGIPIVFAAQADSGGQIIIINVTHINNHVVVINRPRHEDEDGDDQGED